MPSELRGIGCRGREGQTLTAILSLDTRMNGSDGSSSASSVRSRRRYFEASFPFKTKRERGSSVPLDTRRGRLLRCVGGARQCSRARCRRPPLGRIGPAGGQPHPEEHMRAMAGSAPRPARPEPADHPIRAEALPNHAGSGPAPRAQPATTIGTRHAPDQQAQLDNNRIMTYREHQRGLYASERPGVILKDCTPGHSSIRTSSA